MTTETTIAVGDRVTDRDNPNREGVLGTVRMIAADGRAYVHFAAYGHLAVEWLVIDRLDVWRPA